MTTPQIVLTQFVDVGRVERCAATSADDGVLLVPSTVPSVGRCVCAARAASAGRNREGGVVVVVGEWGAEGWGWGEGYRHSGERRSGQPIETFPCSSGFIIVIIHLSLNWWNQTSPFADDHHQSVRTRTTACVSSLLLLLRLGRCVILQPPTAAPPLFPPLDALIGAKVPLHTHSARLCRFGAMRQQTSHRCTLCLTSSLRGLTVKLQVSVNFYEKKTERS